VLHEKESPDIHVDVYVVYPTPERNYHYLITSGMSEKPMPVPDGAADGRYSELILGLPPDWPLSMEAFSDEANYWPVRLLKGLARYAHDNKTWLYAGHSILWSDPPKPFASNTRMAAVLLMRPRLVPEEAQIVHVRKNKRIRLWGFIRSMKKNWN
jgi:Suppressor of fused protein (SUFU)